MRARATVLAKDIEKYLDEVVEFYDLDENKIDIDDTMVVESIEFDEIFKVYVVPNNGEYEIIDRKLTVRDFDEMAYNLDYKYVDLYYKTIGLDFKEYIKYDDIIMVEVEDGKVLVRVNDVLDETMY